MLRSLSCSTVEGFRLSWGYAPVESVPAPLVLHLALFQYSIDPSSGFSVVVAEDSCQPFLSGDRP